EGIVGVIEGRTPRFYLEYPCHSPTTQRWFSMHVSPLHRADMDGVVIAHENITDRKLSEIRAQELADDMRRLSSHLDDAREEERTHLAREIHDELGQSLTALKMDLTDIRAHAATFPQQTRDRLLAMGSLLDQTAHTVQRLAGELRPPMLDELGLLAAVGWYIQDFEERFGIACTRLRFDDPPATDRKRATALYRILQEGLTNVARHANAGEVEIQMVHADNTVALIISDDGKGITDEEMKKLSSHGIIGMRERITAYGGTLSITGRPGIGTTVHASIPWPKE
ncbi:partial Oxygen sensor histidine kinase NreB, partial [uncultured bacterium]